MKRATDLAARHATDIAGNLSSAATKIDGAFTALSSGAGFATLARLPALARNAAVGFLAFEAVKFTIMETARAAAEAQERLEELVKIATRANAAGVGTTFLQSLTGQAKELHTEAGKLEAMLTRAREAATLRIGEGKEAASSAIEDRLRQNVAAGNLGADALSRYRGADDMEKRIRIILDLIEQLQREGRNLAAFDLGARMFGSDFEMQLRNGVDIIGAMKRALDGLTVGDNGRIIRPEEIARAKAINDQLEEARRIMADALRPLNEDIARWQQVQLQATADLVTTAAQLVGVFGAVYEKVRAVGDAITAIGNLSIWKTIREGFDAVGLSSTKGLELVDPEKIKAAEEAAGKPIQVRVAPRTDRSVSLPSLSPGRASRDSGTETDQLESFINSLTKANVALRAEVENYAKSNAEKAVAINLAKAEEIAKQNDVTLTEEQISKIRQASTETATYKDKLADLAQQQRQAAEAARYFGDALSNGLADAILEGKSFSEVLTNIVNQLGRSAIQALITGQGPLAGLLGMAAPASAGSTATGGLIGLIGKGLGFAEGGFVSGPGTSTSDSVPARLSNGEFVVNAKAVQRHRALLEVLNSGGSVAHFAAGGLVGPGSMPAPAVSPPAGGPTISISAPITLQAQGGTPEQNQELARMMGQQVEGAMRRVATEEILRALRPNGLLRR
ncbi:hypothetical protein GMJLKIPL_2837 [Methylobacterium isbiliense]|uniref:Bacteriophage tail tape measure C-terminal domain-containing protein n=2 Tax=Methylobacterium isbiliense TaxID=315478 RepID=A0ABQ4SEG8_9HYPH|nr:hypothetical protein GMJLKIPL_2837 [Methylobacterium isbiliense]